MNQQDFEKLKKIRQLLKEAYDHYFEFSDGHCKRAEGNILLDLGNYWDNKDSELKIIGINIYSYVLGHRRDHYFKSLDEALDTVVQWHKEEMETNYKEKNMKVKITREIEVEIAPNVYLNGADLSGANLSGANLIYSNFRNANLRNSNLRNANLRRTDLKNADLTVADLVGANLSDANLRGADLTDANLTDANLSGADLAGVNFKGAVLRNADLSGTNLRNTDLSDVDLGYANLKGAKISDLDQLVKTLGIVHKKQ